MIYFDVLARTGDSLRFVISETTQEGTRILRADGSWSEQLPEGADFTEATLTIRGASIRGMGYREIQQRIADAFAYGLPETSVAAEAKVLREVLAVEQARVDRALDARLAP